ncbi:Rv1733c family protein [Streptomyces sedi]|uniref:Uncharacterized protein n=1 Tax=Streptomyces sedi TaxID=555059 RepID=A0A5C4URV5_9ACTN|nr:hypothetical protein [Streptomyces sedi]TNM26073.1 hypothetical protein FH715_25230 [Streptomyces sedi]
MSEPIPRAQPPPADRWWRWRRNPLRRRADLVQAWVGLLLASTVAVAAPLVAWTVGFSVHEALTAAARREAGEGRHLEAALVADAPRHPEPGSAEARETRYPAEVRYTAPDGTVRTGTAEVPPGLAAGARTRIWVNGEGHVAEPPMTEDAIRYRAVGWGAAGGGAVAVTGRGAYAATACLLDRRRAAAWDEAWRRASARWTAPP